MKRRIALLVGVVVVAALVFGAVPVWADNSVASSTMIFEGTLADEGGGVYSGVLAMVDELALNIGDDESGYDIYARNGDVAWFGDDPGSGPVWTEVAIGTSPNDHDAWSGWDPDTPDWYQYSLNLYHDGGEYKWAVRNHPGATAANPWSSAPATYPPKGVPMSGAMNWTNNYACESDTGAYLPGTNAPEIPDGAASKGGGPACWDMDWSWGSEVVPLAFPGFDVSVAPLGGGSYRVTLTPARGPAGVSAPGPVVNENTGESYGTIQAAIDDASAGDTINVAAGTYREYLHITKDGLTIEGAGIDQSIVDLDGLTPYWHYGTCTSSYASRAGVYIVGYGSPDEIVENVTFRGFTVKNAGLNPPTTATGIHTGLDNQSTLTDSTKSWTAGALVGQWVHNYGDRDTDYKPARSYGQITANTANTVTVALSGGKENDWDTGDQYLITPYKHFHNSFWIHYPNYDGVRGISIGNGNNILIQNCKVTDSGYGGITTGYARCVSTHKYSEYVTVDNCIITDHPTAGISIGNHVGPFTITNNVCKRIKRPAYHDATREYSGFGIQVSGTKNYGTASGLIADNECRDNGFEGIIVTKYTDGVTVENNTVTGHNFDEDGAGIFFYHWGNPDGCKNHLIKNNTVTGNIRGIVAYYASNSTIEGNTITTDSGAFDPGQGAIKLDNANNITVKDNDISCDGVGIRVTTSGSHDNTFTGNTIDGAMFAGVYITSGAYDNTFTNNEIKNTTSATFTGYADWGSHTGSGNAAVLTDNTKSWTDDQLTGFTVMNLTDGSAGVITDNDATSVTASLAGGTENDWDLDDEYDIVFDEVQGDGVFLRGGDWKDSLHAGTGNLFNYNSIHDNAGDGMENQVTTMTVDAEYNWWGHITGPQHATTNPSGSGNPVSDNVKYSPWVASSGEDFHKGIPGWQPDMSAVGVSTNGTIQEGIDAVEGSTVSVAAGTYYENIVIDKSLALKAASSPIIDGGGSLGPGVYITASNVTFQGFTITNFTCSPSAGMGAIWVEGDGAKIDSNTIYNITPTGADPAGIGIDVHASHVDVTNNVIHDVGSIGIRVRHDFANSPTVSNDILLENNEVYRTGNSGVLITGYAKGVTIKGNEIYESLAPTPYNLFVHYGAQDVTIENNHIYDTYANIVLAGCDNVTIKDNVIEGATPLPSDLSKKGKNIYILNDYGSWFDVDALSTNVDISGNNIRNADGWGIWIRNGGAADPSDMAATTTINFNNISGNSEYGVQNDVATTVDAQKNWWGHASGPSPEGPGSGDAVSTNVDYSPWLGNYPSDPGSNTYVVDPSSSTADIQALIDSMSAGDTLHFTAGSYAGGFTISVAGIIITADPGAVIGPGSPGMTVNADDVTIRGLVIDGSADSGDSGIVVNGGADNLIVEDNEIRKWTYGIQVVGSVNYLKVVSNWIHDNTDAGLQIESGVYLGDHYTIYGNLFKENGGPGIRNDGTSTDLGASYNSWGHLSGAASGDGVVGSVNTDPFTFAEVFVDVDASTPDEETSRPVVAGTSFDVLVRVDAATLYGLTFKLNYDADKLKYNSMNASGSDFFEASESADADDSVPAGTITYLCTRLSSDGAFTKDGGKVLEINFTARDTLTGDSPWEAYFDLSHAEADTSSGAEGGVKVFMNNAGFGDASDPDRDITDDDDGLIYVTGGFVGFVNLQGRTDDSGATVEVWDGADRSTAKHVASGTSASSGAYTTDEYIGSTPTAMVSGTDYYFLVDAPLYLPTTAVGLPLAHRKALDPGPFTAVVGVDLLGGDAIDDNIIDIADLVAIGNSYGTGGPSGDVNADGIVNILDLVLAGGNYGKTSSQWDL